MKRKKKEKIRGRERIGSLHPPSAPYSNPGKGSDKGERESQGERGKKMDLFTL